MNQPLHPGVDEAEVMLYPVQVEEYLEELQRARNLVQQNQVIIDSLDEETGMFLTELASLHPHTAR